MATPDYVFSQDPAEFFSNLRAWEAEVRRHYDQVISSKGNPALHMKGQFAINLSAMLNEIPASTRENLLFQYKKIIGFNDVMDSANLNLRQPDIGGRNPAWRVNVDPRQLSGPNANPLALVWNRMFVQQRYGKMNVSSNILTADFLEGIYGSMRSGVTGGIEAGKSVFVFDTETAGIIEEFGGIRQVSGVTGSTALDPSTGRISLSVDPGVIDKHFNVARMQLGAMSDGYGGLTRLNDWVRKKLLGGAAPSGAMGDGSAFADGMRPVLEQMRRSDYIVAHNVAFDINQVMTNLVQTTEYLENVNGFADLVNDVGKKLSTPGVVKDTLEMVRAAVPEMSQAPELLFKGERSLHSLENVALQTNLFSLMERDGTDIGRMLGVGSGTAMMHAAEVDTRIESHLLKYLLSGELQSGVETPVGAVRGAILRSYAPTPISNIGDPRHVDRGLMQGLIDETRAGRRESIRVWDINQKRQIDISQLSDSELLNKIDSVDDYFTDIKVNPIEQEIWATRRGLAPAGNTTAESVTTSLGQWRRYTEYNKPNKGFQNKAMSLFKRGIRPSTQSMTALQDSFAAAGIPFAGISEIERTVTTALAHAGSLPGGPSLSAAEANTARLAEDLGISRFSNFQNAFIGQRSNVVGMPVDILREAESAGILSSNLSKDPNRATQFFGISHGRNDAGKAFVNLTYSFDNPLETEAFASWLEEMDETSEVGGKALKDWGLSNSQISNTVQALRETGDEYGVRVGSLTGQAAEHARTALESLFQGIDRDGILEFRAGMIDSEDGVTRTGAFFLNRFVDQDGFMSRYKLDLVRANRLNSITVGVTEVLGRKGAAQAVEGVMQGGSKTANALTKYNKIKGKIGIGIGIASLAGIGYYINQKHKSQKIYDQTMAKMPVESRGDYLNYREEMGLGPAPIVSRNDRLDPLVTAGTVGNLDRNKIGHTYMGPNKYNSLYGGVM